MEHSCSNTTQRKKKVSGKKEKDQKLHDSNNITQRKTKQTKHIHKHPAKHIILLNFSVCIISVRKDNNTIQIKFSLLSYNASRSSEPLTNIPFENFN